MRLIHPRFRESPARTPERAPAKRAAADKEIKMERQRGERALKFAFKLRLVQTKFSMASVPHAISAAHGIIIFCI